MTTQTSQNPAADRLRQYAEPLPSGISRFVTETLDEALVTAERNAYDKVRARLDPLRNADEHAHMILDELSEARPFITLDEIEDAIDRARRRPSP